MSSVRCYRASERSGPAPQPRTVALQLRCEWPTRWSQVLQRQRGDLCGRRGSLGGRASPLHRGGCLRARRGGWGSMASGAGVIRWTNRVCQARPSFIHNSSVPPSHALPRDITLSIRSTPYQAPHKPARCIFTGFPGLQILPEAPEPSNLL